MESFISGVIGSLVASVIWALLILISSKRIIKTIKTLFMSLFDSGAQYIFTSVNDQEYLDDIKKEFELAKLINIYTSRGKYLENQPYRKILNKSQSDIKILLPNYKSNQWITMRTQEVNNVDDKYTDEAFRLSIEATIRYLKTCKSNVKLKTYNSIHIGRIIMTDRVVYFSPYLKNTYGEDVVIYKYVSNSTMYKWAERIFSEVWKSGTYVNYLVNNK